MKKQKKKNESQKINLDNEIIIGLTPKKEPPKKKKQKPKSKTQISTRSKNRQTPSKRKNNKTQSNKKIKQKTKKNKIIKLSFIFILLALCILLFLLSSVFNIKQIIVTGANKVTEEEVISLSQLQINENMFKTLNSKIIGNLKKNPYIKEVKIRKNFNGIVNIDIIEREVTYMVQNENIYAYIDNQGYIVETNDNPLEVPILTGYSTDANNIAEGNRLDKKDLEKLDVVIKIMDNLEINGMKNLVTSIEISNFKDLKIVMEEEKKVVHFGDSSSINEKVLWIKDLVERNKGIEGDIFVKNPQKNAYFRSKV